MGFIRGGETITIQRRSVASTDAHGNPTHTTASITVRDALISIESSSETIDPERDAIDASLTLYLPAGTQIMPGDKFVIRGTTWIKDSSVQEWVSPFPMEAGVIVKVRKRIG